MNVDARKYNTRLVRNSITVVRIARIKVYVGNTTANTNNIANNVADVRCSDKTKSPKLYFENAVDKRNRESGVRLSASA